MTLKSRLSQPNILVAPGIYDGITAAIAADSDEAGVVREGAGSWVPVSDDDNEGDDINEQTIMRYAAGLKRDAASITAFKTGQQAAFDRCADSLAQSAHAARPCVCKHT